MPRIKRQFQEPPFYGGSGPSPLSMFSGVSHTSEAAFLSLPRDDFLFLQEPPVPFSCSAAPSPFPQSRRFSPDAVLAFTPPTSPSSECSLSPSFIPLAIRSPRWSGFPASLLISYRPSFSFWSELFLYSQLHVLPLPCDKPPGFLLPHF